MTRLAVRKLVLSVSLPCWLSVAVCGAVARIPGSEEGALSPPEEEVAGHAARYDGACILNSPSEPAGKPLRQGLELERDSFCSENQASYSTNKHEKLGGRQTRGDCANHSGLNYCGRHLLCWLGAAATCAASTLRRCFEQACWTM